MRNRGRARRAGRRLAGLSGANLGHQITQIAAQFGNGQATTRSAHGITAGQNVTISGNSHAAYNATFEVTAVPTATTFEFSTAELSVGTGGKWEY